MADGERTVDALTKTIHRTNDDKSATPLHKSHLTSRENDNFNEEFQRILDQLPRQKRLKCSAEQAQNLDINSTVERLQTCCDKIHSMVLSDPTNVEIYAHFCLLLAHVKVQVTGQERETAKVCFKSGIISSCLREFQRNSLDERETMLKAIEDASSEEEKKIKNEELIKWEIMSHERSLVNAQFIAQLFKLEMLPESIMDDCIKQLFRASDERALERFCRLIVIAGEKLDHPLAKQRMDQHFKRVADIIEKNEISPHICFMLQDLVEMRENKWQSRPLEPEKGPEQFMQLEERDRDYKLVVCNGQDELRLSGQRDITPDIKRTLLSNSKESGATLSSGASLYPSGRESSQPPPPPPDSKTEEVRGNITQTRGLQRPGASGNRRQIVSAQTDSEDLLSDTQVLLQQSAKKKPINKSRESHVTLNQFLHNKLEEVSTLSVVTKRKNHKGNYIPPLMEDGEQIGKKKRKRSKKRSKKQMPELPDRMELQIEDGIPTSPSLMENNGDNPNTLDLLEQPQDEQDELDGQHQEAQVLTPLQQQHNIEDDPLASTSPHHHREDGSTSPQNHEEDGLQLPLSARYHRNDGPQVPTTCPQQHGDDSPQTPTSPQCHGDDPHIPPTHTQYHDDDDPQVPTYTQYHGDDDPQVPPTHTQYHGDDDPQVPPTHTQYHDDDDPQVPTYTQYHGDDDPQVPPTHTQYHGDDDPQVPPTHTQYHGDDDPQVPPTHTQYHGDDDPQVPNSSQDHRDDNPLVSASSQYHRGDGPRLPGSFQYHRTNGPRVSTKRHHQQSSHTHHQQQSYPQVQAWRHPVHSFQQLHGWDSPIRPHDQPQVIGNGYSQKQPYDYLQSQSHTQGYLHPQFHTQGYPHPQSHTRGYPHPQFHTQGYPHPQSHTQGYPHPQLYTQGYPHPQSYTQDYLHPQSYTQHYAGYPQSHSYYCQPQSYTQHYAGYPQSHSYYCQPQSYAQSYIHPQLPMQGYPHPLPYSHSPSYQSNALLDCHQVSIPPLQMNTTQGNPFPQPNTLCHNPVPHWQHSHAPNNSVLRQRQSYTNRSHDNHAPQPYMSIDADPHQQPYRSHSDRAPPQSYMSIDADPRQQPYRSHSNHGPLQHYMTLPCQGLQQMDPTPPKISSVTATQSSPLQKRSYASALQGDSPFQNSCTKGDLVCVTLPEDLILEFYKKDSTLVKKPLRQPGLVVDVRDSDGALVVRYPSTNENVLLHAATVTKVTHFKGDDVMIVNDRNLICKYHGENKVKFCGKLGNVEKVVDTQVVVNINNQEVLFDQYCLMPICKDAICNICYDNISNKTLNCNHMVCSQCLPKLLTCPFCRRPINRFHF